MTQAQREAILELTVLAIFADSHISLTENQALESAINQLGWESERPRDLAFLMAMARARAASESEAATAAYIKPRAAMFQNAEVQSKALAFLNKVLEPDGVTAEETEFFHLVKDAFPS